MTNEECSKFLTYIKTKCGFENKKDAMIAIEGLCQLGATNRNAGRAIIYTWKNKLITSEQLWAAFSNSKRQSTPRQFARGCATTIGKIAVQLDEPWDLARQMKMDNPEITRYEECWCSTFQSANPNCPAVTRFRLRDNFRKRFE
jgi:hypothetical protein